MCTPTVERVLMIKMHSIYLVEDVFSVTALLVGWESLQ